MIGHTKKKIISTLFIWLPLLAFGLQSIPAQAQDEAPSEDEKKQILEAATEQLYAAEWTIQVTPMIGKKEDRKSEQDVIKLVNGKLHSDKFAKEGFEDSNVTVTVGDDRMIVVETMQRNKEEAVIFWRGELVADVLKGVISKQAPEQTSLSYSFKGSQTATVKPEPEPEPVPPEPQPEAVAELAVEGSEPVQDDLTGEAAIEPPITEDLPAEEDVKEESGGGGIFSDVFSGGKKDKRG